MTEWYGTPVTVEARDRSERAAYREILKAVLACQAVARRIPDDDEAVAVLQMLLGPLRSDLQSYCRRCHVYRTPGQPHRCAAYPPRKKDREEDGRNVVARPVVGGDGTARG